jgi:hypothetical protein
MCVEQWFGRSWGHGRVDQHVGPAEMGANLATRAGLHELNATFKAELVASKCDRIEVLSAAHDPVRARDSAPNEEFGRSERVLVALHPGEWPDAEDPQPCTRAGVHPGVSFTV